MDQRDLIRIWKDEAYREGLSDEERAQFEAEAELLPVNPAGLMELTDQELRRAVQVGVLDSRNCSISTSWCSKTYCEHNRTCTDDEVAASQPD